MATDRRTTITKIAGMMRDLDFCPESDAIVLIKVTPETVEYWDGEDQGELTVDAAR